MWGGSPVTHVKVRAWVGFLTDPLAVPGVVVDYVAEQVGVGDPSCVKRYTERRSTWFEHQTEIVEVYGYTSFASGEAELRRWVDDLAWTSGDGPRSLCYAAVAWLRQRRVLLPGVTTLIELVAEVRKAAEDRLHETLATPVSPAQARSLETVLEVVAGRRRSQLDLWRHGVRNPTGRGDGGGPGPGRPDRGPGYAGSGYRGGPEPAGDRTGPVRARGEGPEAGQAPLPAKDRDVAGHGAVAAGHRDR